MDLRRANFISFCTNITSAAYGRIINHCQSSVFSKFCLFYINAIAVEYSSRIPVLYATHDANSGFLADFFLHAPRRVDMKNIKPSRGDFSAILIGGNR